MKVSIRATFLCLIAVFALLYIIPLGARPIVTPDETRYAEIPREMIARGDWVVPHFIGFRYFEKPVLGYWLNAAAMMLFGENAFAVRLPSALAAGLSALLIFLLARRFGGGYAAGVLAAAIFLTSIGVLAIGTFAILDSALCLFLTAAMVSFFFACMEEAAGKKALFLLLAGASCGLAFLTKGFLAIAVPLVSILPFLAWERRWRDILRLPWLPLAACAAVVLPWAVAVHLRASDFWHYFFWVEHVNRFMGEKPQHPQPFWFFLPVLAVGALPWTFLFPAAAMGLREERVRDPLSRFALCWFLFPFLLFSVSEGKLIPYIMPCFPPLCILTALGLLKYCTAGGRRAVTIGALAYAGVAGAALLFLVVSQTIDPFGFKFYSGAERWKWLLCASAYLAWSAFMLLSARSREYRTKLSLYCAAPVLLLFFAHFLLPDQFREYKVPGTFLLRNAGRAGPDTALVSDYHLAGAVSWFYKRDDVYFFLKGGEFRYGLGYDDSKARMLNPAGFARLVREKAGRGGVALVLNERHARKYRDNALIPAPAFEDREDELVFFGF